MKVSHSHTILYVDDDRDDLELLHHAILQLDGTYELVGAFDGVQGMSRLETMKDTGTLPCLIVLDINMPKMDGKQTFKLIKSDDALRSIPIVIFSTSDSEMDKIFFSGFNVEYIVKPVNSITLKKIAERLLHYCSN